jgi:hypothetical protein
MSRKLEIFEYDQFKTVIDYLKTVKTIIGLSETDGITTISTDSLVLLSETEPIYLQSGQIVTVNNINYVVSNVNQVLKTFNITASNLIANQWNLAINYMAGSRIEINEILELQTTDPDKNFQRFPLIWLFINEKREHKNDDFDFTTNVKFAIVHTSDVESRYQQRLDTTIKLVINPLKTLFLESIHSSIFSKIFNYEWGQLEYDEYIRPFYGSSDKNESVLTTPTDAIELDFNIIFKNQYQ